jgi:hypothetical protein
MWDISYFLPELLLRYYKCGGYVPCCVTLNTHTGRLSTETIFREMFLMTLAYKQHDVIDVIWRLSSCYVKIKRYLSSWTLQFSSNWPPWLGCQLWNICVNIDHGNVPLVVSNSASFPYSWFITGFVTRLTRRVQFMEQESEVTPGFSGVRVTRLFYA